MRLLDLLAEERAHGQGAREQVHAAGGVGVADRVPVPYADRAALLLQGLRDLSVPPQAGYAGLLRGECVLPGGSRGGGDSGEEDGGERDGLEEVPDGEGEEGGEEGGE